MDQVLVGLQGTELFVYLDDIVVYANNLEEHGKRVRRLETIKRSKLVATTGKMRITIQGNSLLRPHH